MVVCVLLGVGLQSPAQDFSVEGNNNQYTITGYFGSGGVVNIPGTIYDGLPFAGTITGITDYAFSAQYSPDVITSITIPSTVTSIGNRIFYTCTALTNVVIVSGTNAATGMGYEAFGECFNLATVDLGNSLTNISDYMFNYCSSLGNIIIPNSVQTIGEAAFFQCTGLTNLTIGTNVIDIGLDAFSYCGGLTNVTIPLSVTNLEGVLSMCRFVQRDDSQSGS